jgi:hypothetical protein
MNRMLLSTPLEKQSMTPLEKQSMTPLEKQSMTPLEKRSMTALEKLTIIIVHMEQHKMRSSKVAECLHRK